MLVWLITMMIVGAYTCRVVGSLSFQECKEVFPSHKYVKLSSYFDGYTYDFEIEKREYKIQLPLKERLLCIGKSWGISLMVALLATVLVGIIVEGGSQILHLFSFPNVYFFATNRLWETFISLALIYLGAAYLGTDNYTSSLEEGIRALEREEFIRREKETKKG